MASDKGMKRSFETKCSRIRWNVIDLTIGYHEDTADALQRHIRQPSVQCGKQPRSIGFAITLAALDHSSLDITKRIKVFFEFGAGLVCLLGAFTNRLTAAPVDNNGDDCL